MNNKNININNNNEKSIDKLSDSKIKQKQKISINDSSQVIEKSVKYNDSELNVIDYKDAKKFDKRGYIDIIVL